MTVARALGVSGELLAGVQRPEGSMNELVQSAVHVAERVERGYPAWVESTADSAGDPPSLQPRALNAAVAVASWQAQLAALSLQSAPQDVDASTWRQRMLLAALSTVPPDAQALDTRVLAAIVSDRLIGQVLTPEQPLALELVQARKLLADESQVSATLLPSAPTYVQLNLGLFRALERQADRPVARWHQALQATRLFQMERMLAEGNSVTGADGNLRELVLQRPNVDVVHVQSLFALLDGCDQLLDDWEQQVAAAKGFDSDMVPVVWHLRTIHTMKARLQLLLEHEQGTASEQAVALEGMQGALQKLRAYAGPVGARAAELVHTAGQLVLDATHSARIWALAHPATLPDARMRELEARLGGARQQCTGETASEIVEALAMLYAAGSRKNKDLIVDAVAKFVESLPATETPATAATVEIVATPASVLADVTELSQWRQMLCAALVAGSLPRRSTGATRAQAVARLRTLTSSTTVGQSSPWALLLTRLSWLANESDGSSALLSLFTDAAYQWYGRLVSGSDLEPFVAAPAQRLGRAVATELAWKSAARLNCALGEHDRAAQESRELLRALAAFEPEEESVLAQVSELVAQLTVVARATSTADVPMPETERLLAALLLDGQPGVDRKLANAWRAELMHACAAVSAAAAPATDAVLLALGDSLDPALAWVAAVETSACVLRVAVPRRPVDPAAKAHAQWVWLGDDVRVRRADVAAYQAVHRSMAGAGESPVVTAHVRDMVRLEQSRTEIELVYRPAENAPRFAELWHEAHTLEQTVVGRIREAARQLADEQLTGEAFDRMQGAVAALQGTLAQFEARVQARYFAAFRDQAQVWLLCVRQMGHALAQLNELRRRAVRVQVAEQAQLVRSLYMQPMGGLPADPESTEHLQTALGQLKTLIYLTPEAGSPLSAYGELLEALLLRVVLGVQVRGVLAASDLASVDLVLRDAYEMHKRATDEQRRHDQEAASLFRFKATEDPTDEQIMGELFPGFEDVFDEDDEQPTASFADIPEETVDVLATCHQYLMLQFGVLEAAPDVRGSLVADAQRQVLQLAASLHMRRPELAAVPAAADRGLRGANVAALAAVLQSMSTDAADAAHLAGVRAEYVYDFYRDACVSEAVQLTPIVSAIAARTVQLQLEWPEHAVLEQIGDMAGRLLQLPATAPLAKLLAGVEQLHERAQDWQAYASRDVAIAELADVARLIIRWRQRELNSWPHLLRAQELASARQANRYWFGLYAALAAPEHVELSELVAAVDHFMQGSPAGEFRGRLNMLQAFAAHRGAVLAASAREQSEKTLAEIRRADSVYGPLLNAVGYYAQFATCIARQLDAAKQAVAKDLAQYVKISSWKDVNPAALRASAQKTHKHLAKCVRRWREALAQPIFQIVQAQQTAGIVTAQVPEVTLELLPLAGAGLDIAPPPSLAALPAGLTTQPWELAVAESDMTAAATDLAQLAEAGVARVLAGSAKSLAQLAKHMAAAPVFGGAIGGSSALEQFAEQIAGDISHFQRVEAPSHLVKRSGPAAMAAPVEKKKRGKILIKSKKEAEAPAYVDDDEERQRQLQQFWGEQRNLRRTRLKDIMRALQELGLKRHARAGDDAPGLTQVLQQQPLDVDAWRESVRVAAALAPAAVLAGSAQAQRDWQMADALFFRLSAQLAQLRSAAFAEHSAEVGPQQVQHILGLGESLNAQVTRDRQAAAELLAAAASWMQAAAPWGSEQALGACVPVARLRRAVDALAAQLAQFGESARAVNAAGGWADAAAVSRVLGAVQVARERVAQAQAQLGAVDSGAAAAQLAGSDATAMLGASAQAAAAAEQAGAAARAVLEAIGDISAEPTRRALAPWLEPTLAAAAQVQRALDGAEPAAKAGDGAELASVAGQWATAVLNVWQSIGR
ncbi:AAA ATPase midasin, partial [Coemansia sp. RSA 2704]